MTALAPVVPHRVVFVAAYLVVSGFILLLTKGLVLLPVVRWLRERSDTQLDLFLRLGGKALIATGLIIIAVWGWRQRRPGNLT